MILNEKARAVAAKMLRPDDFFLTHHRKIFSAMLAMADKSQPVDTVMLMQDLTARGELEAVGGPAYLSQLADGLPRVSNVSHYASIVLSHAIRRRVIHLAANLGEAGFDESQPVEDLLLQASVQVGQVREAAQLAAARAWREKFHTPSELPDGDAVFLIDRILPDGVTFVGANSGVGKTWLALSLARALTRGGQFLGLYDVPEPLNVLYLCPEMSARSFKKRCVRFGISERFFCQTIADGAPLDLADLLLIAAVRELRPVVFLDTAIRFSNAEDENSASENQELARAIFQLIYEGARAVVCLHHRAKEAARHEAMTLENCLRGTGDLGAIASAVYGLRYDSLAGDAAYLKESRKLVRLGVSCVKGRDFVPVEDFRIQLDPYLDTLGDFAVLTDRLEDPGEDESEKVSQAITANPAGTLRQIAAVAGVNKNRVQKLAARAGWSHDEKGWNRDVS
jgi:hypothetical protein